MVIVALWMGVALSCLLVLDIGNLFWQQRELQKIADMSALAGATGTVEAECQSSGTALAGLTASRNGLPEDVLESSVQAWPPGAPGTSAATSNACKVVVRRTVPYLFVWPAAADGARTLQAEAMAVQQTLAALYIRSALLALSTAGSPLLNPLVGGLLGGQINLGVASWEGLARADVQLLSFLDALAPRLGLQVGDYQQLLHAEVALGTLIGAMANAVTPGASASAAVNALQVIATKLGARVGSVSLKLADILQISSPDPAAALNAQVNVFELLQALLQLANLHQAVALDLNLGSLAHVTLEVIQAPQWALGNPQTDRIYTRTAQLQLTAVVDVLLLKIRVGLDVASGEAELARYRCVQGDKSVTANVRSGLLDVKLVIEPLIALLFDRAEANIHLLDKHNAALELAPVKSLDKALDYEANSKDWHAMSTQLNLVQSLSKPITWSSSGGLLGGALDDLLNGLLAVVGGLTQVLALLLDPLLNTVVAALGINLSSVEVAAQMSCGIEPVLVY